MKTFEILCHTAARLVCRLTGPISEFPTTIKLCGLQYRRDAWSTLINEIYYTRTHTPDPKTVDAAVRAYAAGDFITTEEYLDELGEQPECM